MAQVFAFLLAVFKAFPAIKSLWDQFVSYYTSKELSNMAKENVDAIRTAINEHDQRNIEASIGNPNPGQASGDSGARIVPGPPPNITH